MNNDKMTDKVEVVKKAAEMFGYGEDVVKEVIDEMEQENKLTDTQLDQLCNVLRESKSESSKKILQLQSNGGELTEEMSSELGLESVDATIRVNQVTGMSTVIGVNENGLIDENQNVEPVDILDMFEKDKDKINIDRATEVLGGIYDLSENDVKIVYDIMVNNKKNVFDILPQKIKDLIMAGVRPEYHNNKKMIEQFTDYMISNMKGDLLKDKAYDDLQEAITSNMKAITNAPLEIALKVKKYMEEDIINIAEKLKENGNNTKANQLIKISESYKDSYLMTRLMKPRRCLIGKKRVSLNKFLESKLGDYRYYTTTFNNRYQKSSKMIQNVKDALPVLERQFPDVYTDELKKFIILFCIESLTLKVNDWADHTFMYYFLKDIVLLETIDSDCEAEFPKEILNNIRTVIEYINNN